MLVNNIILLKLHFKTNCSSRDITITHLFTLNLMDITCRVNRNENIPTSSHEYVSVCWNKLFSTSHMILIFFSYLPCQFSMHMSHLHNMHHYNGQISLIPSDINWYIWLHHMYTYIYPVYTLLLQVVLINLLLELGIPHLLLSVDSQYVHTYLRCSYLY